MPTAAVVDTVDSMLNVSVSPAPSLSGTSNVSTVTLVALLNTAVHTVDPPVTVVPAVSTLRDDWPLVIVVPLSAVDPETAVKDGDPPSVAFNLARNMATPFVFDEQATLTFKMSVSMRLVSVL